MSVNTKILRNAASHVYALFHEHSNGKSLYHNYNHTHEVVEQAEEIARGMKLSGPDTEVVMIAAWFHDTGYLHSPKDHEERSADIASEFLRRQNYPEEKIEKIIGCIRATKVPQQPHNVLEQVMCDADLLHLGKKDCIEKGERLRMEIESTLGEVISERDWIKRSMEFFSQHHFHTTYAVKEYAERREQNLNKLRKQYKKITGKNGTEEANEKRSKGEKNKKPRRGIETMFRITSSNHLDLSAMADHKANIMISVPSIILSIVVSVMLRWLNENPELMIPTLLLALTCVATIVFAILSTRPKVTSAEYTREEIKKNKVNLLFFGNFYGMKQEDFEWGMRELMNDRELLYGSMIKDLYSLGQVLGKKYGYLRICYNIFLYGMVISVAAFIYAFLVYGVQL